MAWIARMVSARIPHHITQQGNRRQATFFGAEDYQAFIQQNPVRRGWLGHPGSTPGAARRPTWRGNRKFQLLINRTSAKALSLTIPPSVLARADQII